MNAEVLREWLNRRPFEPFAIKLSDGDLFEIRHPENVILLKTRIVLGYPETEQVIHCSLVHINSIHALQLS